MDVYPMFRLSEGRIYPVPSFASTSHYCYDKRVNIARMPPFFHFLKRFLCLLCVSDMFRLGNQSPDSQFISRTLSDLYLSFGLNNKSFRHDKLKPHEQKPIAT